MEIADFYEPLNDDKREKIGFYIDYNVDEKPVVFEICEKIVKELDIPVSKDYLSNLLNDSDYSYITTIYRFGHDVVLDEKR